MSMRAFGRWGMSYSYQVIKFDPKQKAFNHLEEGVSCI